MPKLNNDELNIYYDNLVNPQITTGFSLGVEPYKINNNDEIVQYPKPIINATDINWGGATIQDNKINTTDELLNLLNTGNFGPNSENSIIPIMLNAIRALQAEVTKLRNSFKYGIYSYNEKQTAMSKVVNDYSLQEIDAEEPLWAVDENSLSELLSVNLTSTNNFTNESNIEINVENNTLNFLESSIWEDIDNLLVDLPDPKLYVYLTTAGLDITFNLINVDTKEELSLPLNQLFNSNSNQLYNILFILSHTVKKNKESEEYVGSNFVWIQIGHFIYDGIQQGYYSMESNKISESLELLNGRYELKSISFANLTLSKFNIYTKYQNFCNEVDAHQPVDDDRYRVAHLTIRSIKNYDDLVEIKDKLPENELIFVEGKNSLYIKNEYKLKKIGAGDSPDKPDDIDTMTNKELIETLKKMGIVYEHYSESADSDDYELQLAALDSVTFINQQTGKKFDISIDAYGKLKSEEQTDISLAKQLEIITGEDYNLPMKHENYRGPNVAGLGYDIRGFNARLNFNIDKISGNQQLSGTYESMITNDFKLNSDRIRIASIYAPQENDKIYGCDYGFIELENSGDKDFYLDGCSIFYTNGTSIYSLPLKGKIPAGGTYLIRCKKFADAKCSSNVYIEVKNYDIEWWIDGENGIELLDTSLGSTPISYALVHLDETLETLTPETQLYITISNGNTGDGSAWTTMLTQYPSIKPDKVIYCYDPHLIDSITIHKQTSTNWAPNNFKTIKSNSIYKNTFELDPAKQAYNGFNMYESSRTRWNKPGTDSQTLELNKEFIEFPHSDIKKAVKDYTPKASFEFKNVCTDKTQLDVNRPNMPIVSFGIDAFTTRCFNWISCGLYDEYVFIKQDDNTWIKFASYDKITSQNERNNSFPRRYEYQDSEIVDGYDAKDIINSTYARFTFNLPANGTQITSHKCIVEFGDQTFDLSEPKTYIYKVGRADKNGNPDELHTSKELKFTLYPRNYIPRIYQITDQQGFHWIEYQVWAASAKKILEKINEDIDKENIIPVLINTGDATQAGCRINEWLDYYLGGECLFDHLELAELVGNNDLCGTDFTKLGTGDDEGKSNSFFYSLFFCNQMDPQIPTLIKGINNEEIKYIPSLYYINFNDLRFVCVNSEITYVNAKDWFDLKLSDKYIINPYNGYSLSNLTEDFPTHIYCIDGNNHNLMDKQGNIHSSIANINMVSIYEMISRMIPNNDDINVIAACHEMPFTVVTHANMLNTTKNAYRSVNKSSLVGSHLNQLIATETGEGTYWFSRLLESRGVKLCIGGHKHTYCYTYPLREYYEYIENGVTKNSLDDGPMNMGITLANDSVIWTKNGQNMTKFPCTNRTNESMESITNNEYLNNNYFVPVTLCQDNNSFVIYFMCQATGYKLTSNKELPTPIQAFTQVLPQTMPTATSDKPDANQKYPMFAIISFKNEGNIKKANIKNIRIAETYVRGMKYDKNGIYDPYSDTFNFNQQSYSTKPMKLQYLVDINHFNELYWNGETYGDHFDGLDIYNNTLKGYDRNTQIAFNNYGVWTSEETTISNDIII